MILRVFLTLFLLNVIAFAVQAEADDRPLRTQELGVDSIEELQDHMSGDFDQESVEALTDLGSRLLSWRFSKRSDDGRAYASEAAAPDHSIALINNGACLNLRWNF